MPSGLVATVPMKALEKKLGKTLGLGEQFTTAAGTWKVIQIGKDGRETYTVEQIA